MELRGYSRHLSRLLEGIRTIHYRHDNPLVAYTLETLVPHQLCTTAPTRNSNNSCSSSIHCLSIHHRRPTSLYLFSILNFLQSCQRSTDNSQPKRPTSPKSPTSPTGPTNPTNLTGPTSPTGPTGPTSLITNHKT